MSIVVDGRSVDCAGIHAGKIDLLLCPQNANTPPLIGCETLLGVEVTITKVYLDFFSIKQCNIYT
jgi:hypothetical protein